MKASTAKESLPPPFTTSALKETRSPSARVNTREVFWLAEKMAPPEGDTFWMNWN